MSIQLFYFYVMQAGYKLFPAIIIAIYCYQIIIQILS